MGRRHELLVIDQAPILGEALDACQRALRAIERCKLDLAQHEARDVPAYDRWYNTSFGRLLTELREARSAILDKETVLLAVRKRHWERFFNSFDECAGEVSPGGRGAAVFDEDSGAETGGFRVFDAQDGDPREVDEEEGEYGPGAETARYSEDAGIYDDEQDYADEDSGAAWFESLFARGYRDSQGNYRARGEAGEQGGARGRAGSGPGVGTGAGAGGPDSPGEGADARVSALSRGLIARIKDRYRLLVKQLHPDANPDQSAERRELWNRVQKAYRESDLDELDLLLALTGALSGSVPGTASLQQLRGVAREIERLAAALGGRVEEIRCSRAWKFSELDAGGARRLELARKVEKELQTDRARLWRRIRELDEQIARFAPKARGKAASRGVIRPNASV